MLPDIINYIPDPQNGRPIANGRVYFLIDGYMPPMRDADLDQTKIAPVTANNITVPQPIYTSKGGTLIIGSQTNQPGVRVSTLVARAAVYDKCGKLVFSIVYNGFGADAATVISETAPNAPFEGMRWYKPSDPATYIYYIDVDGEQWVQESGAFDSFDNARVSSISQLRSTEASYDGQILTVNAYYANGTTGGGDFQWNAASTAADDSGVTIAVAGVATGRWVRRLEGFVTPEMFGARGDGAADDTVFLTLALSYGGSVNLNGAYLIAGSGADAGGVSVTIVKDTKVTCSAETVFLTDSLDNDLIRVSVPSSGDGLPVNGIDLKWTGGTFDQRNQKVSAVVPFLTEYPAGARQGVSATSDGLSVRGDYAVSGVEYSGIRRCVIDGVTTIAGEHWQSAGGDSGIFVSGCKFQMVKNCLLIGNRDLGIYASGSASGTLPCKTIIDKNFFVNCFHGAAIKRSASYGRISNNHAENCPRAYLMDLVVGTGFNCSTVSGNTGDKCGIFVRASLCQNFNIKDNNFTRLGATLEDGVTIESFGGADCLVVMGGTRGTVKDNKLDGQTAGLSAAYPLERTLILCTTESTTNTKSTFINFASNIGNELRALGQDAGESNQFIENIVYNAESTGNMSTIGLNSYEVRISPVTSLRTHRNTLLFSDGSVTEPIIARASQASVGVRFATNLVALVNSSVDRVSASNLGVAFNGATPVARPAYTSATGSASRSTFETSTATTQQLAERLKAVIDDLKIYGLFG